MVFIMAASPHGQSRKTLFFNRKILKIGFSTFSPLKKRFFPDFPAKW